MVVVSKDVAFVVYNKLVVVYWLVVVISVVDSCGVVIIVVYLLDVVAATVVEVVVVTTVGRKICTKIANSKITRTCNCLRFSTSHTSVKICVDINYYYCITGKCNRKKLPTIFKGFLSICADECTYIF